MNNIKLKQRVENAFNAFFENQYSSENDELTFAANAKIQREETSKSVSERLNVVFTFLKQALFFFPGSFFLCILSMAFGILVLYRPPTFGSPGVPYSLMGLIFVISIFATWFGLGDLRKIKHSIIPASIVVFSFLIGIFTGLGANLSKNFEVIFKNELYPMCIFPFVLMIPFLAKGWVDMREEQIDG